MHEKIRDPMMELFMGIDVRIERAIKLIMEDKDIPKPDIQRLITDKESLLEIFKDPRDPSKEISFDKYWSAYDLINKINYILEV